MIFHCSSHPSPELNLSWDHLCVLLHKELFTPLQTTEQHLQIFIHDAHKLQDKRLLYAAEQQENEFACKCVTVTYRRQLCGKSFQENPFQGYHLPVGAVWLQGQVSLFSNAGMHFYTGDLIPKDPSQKRTVPCTRVAGASITNIFSVTVALCSLFFLLGQKNLLS